jgi:soluble lytic murein transglycosylase-like protein
LRHILTAGFLVISTPALAETVPDMVRSEAIRQGVPVGLALAIAKSESNFRCSAVGRGGERGVMQIKPRTARGIGYRGSPSGLNNCRVGIRYGMIYLRMAHRSAKGNVYRTALLYNAGLGSKRKKSAYAAKIVQKTRRY